MKNIRHLSMLWRYYHWRTNIHPVDSVAQKRFSTSSTQFISRRQEEDRGPVHEKGMVFLAPRLSLQLHAVDTNLKCDWLLSYTSSGSAARKGLGSLFILISAALRDFFLFRVEGCILWKWRLGSKYTQTHNYFILCNWVGLIFPSPLFPAPAEWRWCLQTYSAKAVNKDLGILYL